MDRRASGNAPGIFTNLSARTVVLVLLQIVAVLLAIDLLGRPSTGSKAVGVGAAAAFCILNVLVIRSSSRDRRN